MKIHYAVCILYIFWCNLIISQGNWQQLEGPYAADVRHIETDDSVIVAGLYPQGLYTSHDNGLNWQRLSATAQVNDIQRDGNMLVVVRIDSLVISTDHFQTWVTRRNPGGWKLYQKNGIMYMSGYWSGNVFSIDTGQTWQPLAFSFSQLAITDSVWMRYDGLNYWKSYDASATWIKDSVLSGSSAFIFNDSNRIWVNADKNVYCSSDNGNSWQLRYQGTQYKNPSALKKYAGKLYLQLNGSDFLTSTDNGITWTSLPEAFPTWVPDLCATSSSTWKATSWGIFRSTDEIHWSRSSTGLKHAYVNRLQTNGSQLICNCQAGLSVSQDGGQTWNDLPWIDSTANGFKAFYYTDSLLFAVDWHYGIFYSSDTGQTWLSVPNIQHSYWTDNILYKNGTLIVPQLVSSETIERSTNMGATWSSTTVGYFSGNGYVNTYVTGSSHALVYAREHVFKSADDGLSWTNTGLPPSEWYDAHYSGMYFYLTSISGNVYRGDSSGNNWTNVLHNQTQAFEKIASYGTSVFVSSGRRIYHSYNHGVSWQKIDSLPFNITSLTYSFPYLYAGSETNGIWRSQIAVIPSQVVEEVKPQSFAFPNPFTNTISISAPEGGSYRLSDIHGSLIRNGKLNQQSSIGGLDNLAPGIYLLQVNGQVHKMLKLSAQE